MENTIGQTEVLRVANRSLTSGSLVKAPSQTRETKTFYSVSVKTVRGNRVYFPLDGKFITKDGIHVVHIK